MQSHLMGEWGDVPLSKIDHSSVQAWIRRLSNRLSPATVDKCRQLMSAVMKAAIRDRLVAATPSMGYNSLRTGGRPATTRRSQWTR